MDDVKSKKTQEIKGDDFSDLIKLVIFSGIGCCVFFLPLSINNQIVFPLFISVIETFLFTKAILVTTSSIYPVSV